MRLFISLLFISFLSLIGCGSDSPTFSLLTDTETFQQNKSTFNNKVDILWVIDNSGSMATSQANLTANFQSFIEDFDQLGFDYRIAVTTTEGWTSQFTTPYDSSITRWADGVPGNYSGVRVIEPSTPDLYDTFVTNATQGIGGLGDERAFQSMEEALLNPDNQDFRREGAFLAVIIVSDEDDFSHNATNFNESYTNPGLYSISYYTDFLDNLTGSTSQNRLYSVSSMAIFDQACLTQLNNNWQKIGVRYEQIADATEGVKSSLCGNFADELKIISNKILTLTSQFYLSRLPIESTISVKVNGAVVPQLGAPSATDGWEYNSSSNSILFHGTALPSEGATIEIDFDPLGIGV